MRIIGMTVLGAIATLLLLVLPLPTNEIPRVLEPHEEPQREATLMFGGDMMFDRYIRTVTETVGGDYVFSCIDQALFAADAVVANLEGPITSNLSVSQGATTSAPEHFKFTFPVDTAHLLARHNVFIVNIGNNHINNFGEAGMQETIEHLTRADVAYFGAPLELSLEEVPFTFVNYNQFSHEDRDTMMHHSVAAIEAAKEKGRVPVVYTHWGEEYALVNAEQRALAHQFIDAGAEIVIGSHPHIVQEVERYQEKYIYYSLGNFIFDQYIRKETQQGLLVSVTFTKQGVKSIQEIPITLYTDGRTCVTDPVER